MCLAMCKQESLRKLGYNVQKSEDSEGIGAGKPEYLKIFLLIDL